MDAGQLNQVVDKLAEKIGVAADKLMPIGEEALRQYAMRNYVGGIVNSFVLVAGIVLLRFGYKLARSNPEGVDEFISGVAIAAAGSIMSFVGAINITVYFGRAVSPLPALLGF